MKALVSLCAESAVVDIATNSASVFNILEEVTAIGLPFVVPKVTFFVLLTREEIEPADTNGTFVVKNNDSEIVRHGTSINFKGKLRARVSATISGLLVVSAGKLTFELWDANTQLLSSWVVIVNQPNPALAEKVTHIPQALPIVSRG